MRPCWFIVLGCLLLGSGWAAAQESTTGGSKIVAFVEDNQLRTASITDIGADGLTRLGEIFRRLGAATRMIRLDEDIPADVDLVILVRPSTPLQPQHTGRLWDYLSRGGNLLLAVDPNGINRINGERATSGLNRLLLAEYGIGANDDVLVETWFGREQFTSVVTTWTSSQPEEFVRHPVVEPLARFEVPVYIWAARSVQVNALVPDTEAYPLVFTETSFGETNRSSFLATEPEPVELNIGVDRQGRLLIGGIGENLLTGSRVALLGDSEIVQNIFGLTYISDESSAPRYPGNRILMERLAAWLLEVPQAAWPGLPEGFTWIALDGDASDWDETLPAGRDAILDAPRNDIELIRAFYNDQYLYLLIQVASEMTDAMRITLTLDDVGVERQFQIGPGEAALIHDDETGIPLPDAGMSADQVIEVRLPRRVLSSAARVVRLCLHEPAMNSQDCLEQPISPPQLTSTDPVPVRPATIPVGFLRNTGNLRTEPSTTAPVVTALFGRTPVGIVGRNEAGDWVKVRDARWEGWIAVALIALSADVEKLPVVP